MCSAAELNYSTISCMFLAQENIGFLTSKRIIPSSEALRQKIRLGQARSCHRHRRRPILCEFSHNDNDSPIIGVMKTKLNFPT